MSSYLSNILTNTTSKYNTLRQNLTSSETDGDTEDDSHISRVLRAYYTEKGRQFPQWLPPDPKRPALGSSVTSSFTSSLRNPANSPQLGQQQHGQGRGSLSDLWDQPAQQAPPPQQPMSLRRQAAERGGGPGFRGQGQGHEAQAHGSHGQMLSPTMGRPLPSQRAGSYQSVASQQSGYSDPSPPQSSGGVGGAAGGTAQERLKARLWGRAGSATNLSQQGLGQGQGQGQGGSGYPSRDRFGSPAGPR